MNEDGRLLDGFDRVVVINLRERRDRRRQVARELTRPAGHPEGGPMYPDGALNEFRVRHPGVRTLLAVPSLGDQRSSRSDLHPRAIDRVPLLRGLANAARAVRARQMGVARPRTR